MCFGGGGSRQAPTVDAATAQAQANSAEAQRIALLRQEQATTTNDTTPSTTKIEDEPSRVVLGQTSTSNGSY
jgi:hypothetical protein